MSRSIDERVVEMRFDNKQFESNARESIGTLGKLKDALSSATSKDFTNLEKVANSINFNGLGGAVDAVGLKFSALEIAAITALQNIVNKAVDTGVRLVKSLSVDQISAGFGEYELKMGSIQTIMASTGESLETVNGYLDELNTYADKTIYSFSDMTSNIGKFTNAGVKLEDAVKAIQGVSNVAAVSGANANEASRAMYNFAQALSAGYVKLIDWKSIENANMATVEFKQSLLDTALAMGTVVKEGDKYRSTTKDLNGKTSQLFDATSMFNDSLSSQWMTTDVLVQALNNYSTDVREMSDSEREAYEEKLKTIGYTEEQIKDIEELGKKAFDSAQDVKTFSQLMDTLKESVGSGWAQTFELIFGNFEEAKSMWTVVNEEVGAILQNQADARNDLIQGWKDLGGRDSLLSGISNSWNAFLDIITAVKEAFLEVFPPATAKDLANITKSFENFTKKLQLSDDQLEKLNTAFRGVFSVVDVVAKAIKGFFNLLLPGVSSVSTLGDSILDLAAWIGELLVSFDEWVSSSETISTIYEVLGNSIKTLSDWISIGITSIREFVSEIANSTIVQNIVDGITSAFEKLGNIFTTFKIKFSPFKTVFDLFSSIAETVGPIAIAIFNGIGQALGNLANGFKKVMGSGENGDLSNLLDVGIFAYIIKAIDTLIEKLNDLKKESSGGKGIIERLLGNVDKLFGSLTDTLSNLQNVLKGEVIMKIAEAIAVLAGSMLILSLIDASRLADSLAVMSTMLLEVFGLMQSLSALSGPTNPISALSSYFSSMAQSKTLETVAKSVLILSAALYLIAKVDKDKLFGAFAVISGLIIEMGVLVRALSDPAIGKMKTGVAPLLGVATAILILASAAKKLAELSWEQVAKGLVAVGGLMTELGAFMWAANEFGDFGISSGIGIVLLAAAIKVLEGPIKEFSKMSLTELAKGIGALAVALIAIAGAMRLMPDSGAFGNGVAILLLAAAIKVLEGPIKEFSKMSLKEIAKGLGTLAGALGLIVAAFNLMPDQGSFGSAVSILLAAAAVKVLEDSVMSFATLNWKQIAAALVTLGGSIIELAIGANAMNDAVGGSVAMLIMAAALRVLVPVIKSFGNMSIEQIAKGLATLAGTFIIMGVAGAALEGLVPTILALAGAMALFGVGMAAFGVGLTMIALSATAAVTSIIANLKILIVGVLDIIASTADKLGEAVLAVVLTICDVIIEAVPKIVETILVVVESVLTSLADHAPEIVTQLVNLIVGIVDALAEHIPELIQSVANFVSKFFGAIIDVVNDMDSEAMEKLIHGFEIIAVAMVILAGLSKIASAAMAGVIEVGIVIGEIGALLAALGALKQIPGLQWLIDEGGEMLESIGAAIGKFVGGFVGGALEGVTAGLPQIGTNLSDFMANVSGFIDGASKIDASLMEGVEALAGVILTLTKAEILDGLTSWLTGGTSLSEFGQQLEDFAPHIANYAEKVKNVDPEVVQASANAALALAEMAEKLPGQDGLIDKLFGEKSLSDFGQELEDFAPHLSKYATSVAGVTPEAVEASASAATILAEMADKLPNSGGLAGKIFGENNLSDFGAELEKFGPSMAAYAASISGIDTEAVTASAAAAESLATLASGIPNEGGVVAWWSGDNSLDDFGLQLESFGTSMSNYYTSISTINTELLSNVTASIQELLTLFTNIGSMSTDPMTKFVMGLEGLAKLGIDGFTNAFANSQIRASTAVNNFLNYIRTSFTNAGDSIVQMGRDVASKVLEGLSEKLPKFLTAGNDVVTQYKTGIANNEPLAKTEGTNLSQNALDGVKSNEPEFTTAGENAGQGYANGMNSKIPDAEAAGRALGNAALNATRAVLQEKSPSKAYFQAGDFGGVGFVNGLIENVKNAYEAGRELGGSSLDGVANAISTMSDYINSNIDTNPTITPILDLSDVQKSSAQLASMLNGSIGITRANVSTIGLSGGRFSSSFGYISDLQNGTASQNSTTEINNTFYVQSHDPEGVANETSRIIQRQVVRRDAANGRTGL